MNIIFDITYSNILFYDISCCKVGASSTVTGCKAKMECCGKKVKSRGCEVRCKKCNEKWGVQPTTKCFEKPHNIVFIKRKIA